MRGNLCWLLMTVIGVAGIVARGSGGPGTQAAGDGRWGPTVAKLGSADFAERAAGQKELAKATWEDREVLATLRAGAGDSEVRARLDEELGDLDEWRALHPEEITLDLDKSTFRETVAALGKATGVAFNTAKSATGGSFTLHAKQRPFWEIVGALNEQGPVLPAAYNFGVAGRGAPARGSVAEGVFFCWPGQTYLIGRTGKESSLSEAPLPDLVGLPVCVGVDPRVKVLAYDGPVVTSALDEAGKEMLLDAPHGLSGTFRECDSGQWCFSDNGVAQKKGAKRVSVMKGEFAIRVVSRWATAKIADVQKATDQPVTIAGRRFSIPVVSASASLLELQTEVSGGGAEALPLSFAVRDGGGEVLWESGFKPAGSYMMRGGVPPLSAEVTAPLKVVTLHFAFELKDVTLP